MSALAAPTLLSGGAPLGTALGAIVIAGLITALGSWRLAFIIAGIGTMACGLLAWWYVRTREHPMVSESGARHIEEAHTQKRKIALQRRSVTRSQFNSRTCRVAKLPTLPPRSTTSTPEPAAKSP